MKIIYILSLIPFLVSCDFIFLTTVEIHNDSGAQLNRVHVDFAGTAVSLDILEPGEVRAISRRAHADGAIMLTYQQLDELKTHEIYYISPDFKSKCIIYIDDISALADCS